MPRPLLPWPSPSSSACLSVVLPGLAVAAVAKARGVEDGYGKGHGNGFCRGEGKGVGELRLAGADVADVPPSMSSSPVDIAEAPCRSPHSPDGSYWTNRKSGTGGRRSGGRQRSRDCDDGGDVDDRERRWRARATTNVARLYARRMLTLAEERARATRTREDARENLGISPRSMSGGGDGGGDRPIRTRNRSSVGVEERILTECWKKAGGAKDELFPARFLAGFFPSAGAMLTAVAQCESPAERTEALYHTEEHLQQSSTANSWGRWLRDSGGESAVCATPQTEKPAEWESHHKLDLAQRRALFGQQISPLENTSRLERWSMAAGRIVALFSLVTPLAAAVPLTVVLGRFVGHAGEGGVGGDNEEDSTDVPTTAAASPSFLRRQHERLTEYNWNYALWAIEQAGPTLIKLVQWASTRNDLFSPEFVGRFSKLQDETRGHKWKDTESALERAFGKEWRSIITFDAHDSDDDSVGMMLGANGGSVVDADRERQKRFRHQETLTASSPKSAPIGSGCVAQVYKARLCQSHGLHPAGTSVAVKVQHPKILEKVCLDFYIMNKLASLLEHIPYLNLDYLSIKDTVDQFRDIMLPQLDLRVEAHNLQRFRRDFEGERQIAFPQPLMNLTSREVLVERFVEGEPMLNFVRMNDEHHTQKDKKELATIGLKTVMKMIFLHDFVHADLHPGNMIVDRNKSVRGNPIRINMIDCGLTVELGEHDHVNMVKILGSLIKRDGYSAGQLMVDTAKKCRSTELDVELFCNGIEQICTDDADNNFLESVGDYITDICFLACKHKVKLEASFINAAMACELMEGLASSLYPEMHVQAVALPMVIQAEMMHGLKGLPSPKLWY